VLHLRADGIRGKRRPPARRARPGDRQIRTERFGPSGGTP
jgi:hypothetical protein